MNRSTEPCGYAGSFAIAHMPFYIYGLNLPMKQDEAIAVYNRLNEDTANLLDSVATDPSTRPPFFWHHIRPERQHWGIAEISNNAGPLTRPLFAKGSTTGEYGPNWVAGWLLYSVFRSRDVRNNRNRRKADDPGQAAKSPNATDTPKKEYYDPVRNG
ncbi:hypothetical protein P875_00010300 [Aspergillus terreus]|uniref:Uncharacterized protein n=1 Tax=Aspergillus terreus TaxID=33178 RepID=A0A5M3YSL8_ASPTE|nr:hypothetical protein ATETN484_0003063300 [Aspergillus terreus]GFF14622.1 hypothetical protein P875_00010300 [Aspergillus terreus]